MTSKTTGVKKMAYLVGGLRISLGVESTTPGPRNHIVNFVAAARRQGIDVDLQLISSYPGLRRFASLREGAATTRSRLTLLVSDLVRIGAGLWSGVNVSWRSRHSAADIVYERVAVLQSLASWHMRKRRATRVVESNGIMSVETATDRGALLLAPLASALERHVYRRADLIVAVSPALREAIVDFAGVEPGRIITVPNAMPSRALETPLKQNETLTVGFAGSIVAWQQLDLLLQALAGLKEYAWRLEIVGVGPETNDLKIAADRLRISDRITWLGLLDQNATYDRMASWDIGYSGHKATSSDRMYHSPLKLYEYAAFGLQCLCTPSADAAALESDGLEVEYFEGALELEIALRRTVEEPLSVRERDERRRLLATAHSWDARLLAVVEASSRARQRRNAQ